MKESHLMAHSAQTIFFTYALLLATVALSPTSSAATVVDINLQITDTAGNPIISAMVGDDFILTTLVSDVRSVPEGVFSGYLDILYESSLVSVNSIITYGSIFPNGHSGDTSTSGLIDEAGAFDGFSPLGSGQFELFSILFQADTAGTAVFSSNPADDIPMHNVLVFGSNEPVLISEISFGSTSLQIQPVPVPAAIWLFGSSILGLVTFARRKKAA